MYEKMFADGTFGQENTENPVTQENSNEKKTTEHNFINEDNLDFSEKISLITTQPLPFCTNTD